MGAVWVPPGRQSFTDPNTGAPLEFGTLQHYVPNTTSPKTTWADESQATVNPTIITLDAAGQCLLWGSGLYRQVLKDRNGVQIWDLVTGFIAAGGGGGGDVSGPGSSTVGNFAVWGDATGTLLDDGGAMGLLAHLNTIDNSYWSGAALSVANGGTGATTASGARAALFAAGVNTTNTWTQAQTFSVAPVFGDPAGSRAALGLGALAVLSTITASYVTDFATAVLAASTVQLVAGTNMSITPVGSTLVFAASGGAGGGDVTGPGVAVNGELALFNGTTGKIIKASGGTVPSANGLSLISAADYAAMKTLLALTIGTNVQAWDADLDAIAALTSAANKVPYSTGAAAWAMADFTAAGRALVAGADAAAQRASLALGSAALQATGTSGANVPLLNGVNTWANAQTFTVAPVFTDASGTRTALALGSAALSATTDFEPAGAYSGQNAQTGTTYTLVLGDKGLLVTMSNAAANVLTVPTNASVAFPTLTRIDLASLGAGQTSIAAAGGVTINSVSGKLKLTSQNSGASLVKTGTNTWLLIGDLSA